MEQYLRTYRVAESVKNHFYIQIPQAYVNTAGLTKGQRMFCYMAENGNKGDLIYRPTEGAVKDRKTRVFINTYRLAASGSGGVKVKVPSIYRDVFSVDKGDQLSAFRNDKSELVYRRKES